MILTSRVATLPSDAYVPVLRWRQGEYQALLHLTEPAKDRIVPFITIPEIEYDFGERRSKKSIQEHVYPFAHRYNLKWGNRPAWVGVHKRIIQTRMDDGQDIFAYIFEKLRTFGANAAPVILLGTDSNSVQEVAAIVKWDGLGVAISIQLEDLMKANLNGRVRALASALAVKLCDTDLIIDLGAPNFKPYEVFSDLLVVALRKLGSLHAYRNLVLIGTAIPETFRGIAMGINEIPRHDWLFYQTLIARLPSGMRHPSFGDYTIVHPEFTAVDMRMIKAAAKIVYTTSRSWSVCKGGAFRDNPEQMHDYCADLVGKNIFKGPGFSSGDNYIAKCAARQEGPSNQTRWKDVTINHHITQVLDDLATLGGTP